MEPLFEPEHPILLVTVENNRAFRSTAKTVQGILQEGQLGQRAKMIDAYGPLGSVTLETIASHPEYPVKNAEEAWVEQLIEQRPTALVALDALAGVLIGRWAAAIAEETGEPQALTIGVVGSLWLDPLWSAAKVDRLIVPDQNMAGVLHDGGRAAETLIPIGLGVCGRFGMGVHEGQADCRKHIGVEIDARVLLLVAETLFADDVAEWLEAIADRPDPPVTLVDAAGDRLTLEAAREAHERLGLPGQVFGRVDDAGYFWGAANRVVARAMDNLVARALTFRCPTWTIRPADARQRGISAGLEALGAGAAVHDAAQLSTLLDAPGWEKPLDAALLETVAGAAVPQRIAEAITQLVAGA